MEQVKGQIQFISDLYFRMIDFGNYCVDDNFSSRCKKRKCQFKKFSITFKSYLESHEKTADEKKICFIVLCMTNLGSFLKFHQYAVNIYMPKEYQA